MSKQSFSLKPFPVSGSTQAPDLRITGSIDRHNNTLSIVYELSGNVSKVQIAAPSDTPTRKHDLWQETCFEFFLGIKNSPIYWEFNLSPVGHWNVYRFDDYRQGMREETAYASFPFHIRTQQNMLSLNLRCGLDAIVPFNQILEVAITAVIKQNDGEITFWALSHERPEANFHERRSFIIRL